MCEKNYTFRGDNDMKKVLICIFLLMFMILSLVYCSAIDGTTINEETHFVSMVKEHTKNPIPAKEEIDFNFAVDSFKLQLYKMDSETPVLEKEYTQNDIKSTTIFFDNSFNIDSLNKFTTITFYLNDENTDEENYPKLICTFDKEEDKITNINYYKNEESVIIPSVLSVVTDIKKFFNSYSYSLSTTIKSFKTTFDDISILELEFELSNK